MDLAGWLAYVASLPPSVVWALLFGGALVEYVFPPFPGDTVVVVGAVLVGAHGWAIGPVFAAVCAGTVLGAAIDLQLGRRLAGAPRDRLSPSARQTVDRLVDGFRRWGPALLAINRFLPGIRPLFFVAAGLAGLPTRAVLGWALFSAVLWNGILVALGVALGQRLDVLGSWLQRYQSAVAVVLCLWGAAIVWRWWRSAPAAAS